MDLKIQVVRLEKDIDRRTPEKFVLHINIQKNYHFKKEFRLELQRDELNDIADILRDSIEEKTEQESIKHICKYVFDYQSFNMMIKTHPFLFPVIMFNDVNKSNKLIETTTYSDIMNYVELNELIETMYKLLEVKD